MEIYTYFICFFFGFWVAALEGTDDSFLEKTILKPLFIVLLSVFWPAFLLFGFIWNFIIKPKRYLFG